MTGTPNTAEGDKILIVDDDPGLSSLLAVSYTHLTLPTTPYV